MKIKNITKKLFKRVLFITFLLFFSLSLISPIYAIEYGGIGGKPANPDPNNPRTESIFIFNLEPNIEATDEVLVVNNTQLTKTLLIYATDSQKSTDGSFACEQLSDQRDGVGAWIALEKSEITLKPSTHEKIPFTIHIPESASVGEENGCILIQEKKESSVDSGVALSFRTGLRVVVTIPGEQIRNLKIEDFKAGIDENNLSSKISVKNDGTVSIDANIKILFQGLLGTSYHKIDNNYPILRNDTAVYTYEVSKPFWGGIIYVTSSVEYDESQDASVGFDPKDSVNTVRNFETIALIVPPQPLALAIELAILSVILILLVILFKKSINRKKLKELWTKEYVVNENEDLQSIASSHNLKWKDVAKYNKLSPPYSLKKGQIILISKKSTSK